jgi:hypothetical protein
MMQIFRDSYAGIDKSPLRRVFGLHPITNKIIVPIDLCTYKLDNAGGQIGPDPTLVAFLTGAEIRDSGGVSIGKVEFVDTPSPAGNVNPFVTLNSSSTNIPVISQITPPSISVNDLVKISDTTVSGKISVLLQLLSFPHNASLKIQAFTVQLDTPIGSSFQGSPIIMTTNGKTIGMLLGSGMTVIACPFP